MTPELRPIDLAREALLARLAPLEDAFYLRDEERSYYGALPVERSTAVQPQSGWEGSAFMGDVPRWVGLLPYEAFRSGERSGGISADRRPDPHMLLPEWRRYPAVIEERQGVFRIVAEDPGAADQLEASLLRAPRPEPLGARLRLLDPMEREELHLERIGRALEAIAQGDLYQVTLARRFRLALEGNPLGLLLDRGGQGEALYEAAFSWGDLGVFSGSPELFLERLPTGRVRTRPIKGTRPRHPQPSTDLELRLALDQSEKERAELTMVIDLERNDLGQLAETGSVKIVAAPHVVTHATVHHREATIEAQLRPGVELGQLLQTMLPSGSVTGAPKRAAMDRIAAYEAHRRGLYTGAIGYLAHDGTLRLSMAIRVLTMRAGEAHFYSGGGIVADSDPEQEVAETLWKAALLSPHLGPSETWAKDTR